METFIQFIGFWLLGLMLFFANPINRINNPQSPHNPYHHFRFFLVERDIITEKVLRCMPVMVEYKRYEFQYKKLRKIHPFTLKAVEEYFDGSIENWWISGILKSGKISFLCIALNMVVF